MYICNKNIYVICLAELAVMQPENFCYLNQSPCMYVDGTNDANDFRDTIKGNMICNLYSDSFVSIFMDLNS